MKHRDLITRLEDRWVVEARQSVVSQVSVSQGELRIDFDTGLSLYTVAGWRATHGSPITGKKIRDEEMANLVGARALSFVLFFSGAVRIVLSSGVFVVVQATEEGRTRVALPDRFSFEVHGQTASLRQANGH